MSKQINPFAAFLAADLELNVEREGRGERPHNITWWGEQLDVDRSLVSHWNKGDRRIGPYHEKRVFARLEKYWEADPRWAAFRFTPEQYRAVVKTARQTREAERKTRTRRRRRLSRLRETRNNWA